MPAVLMDPHWVAQADTSFGSLTHALPDYFPDENYSELKTNQLLLPELRTCRDNRGADGQ